MPRRPEPSQDSRSEAQPRLSSGGRARSGVPGVLIVEDDHEAALLVRSMLQLAGSWNVEATDRLDAALDLLAGRAFDVVLLDLNLPDSQGLNTVARLAARAPELAVVVSTALDKDVGQEAVRLGAQDFLPKGSFDAEALSRTLTLAIERKRGQVAAARLSAVVRASRDAILALTSEGTILSWNDGAQRLYGYSEDEACGRSVTLLCAPEGHEVLRLALASVRAGGAILPHDTVHMTRDGKAVSVELCLSPILNPLREVSGVALVARDATLRLEALRRAADAELRYRMLFERNPQPMWVFDLETLRFLTVNEAACRHYGYSRDEFLGLTITDIRPPEDTAALLEQISDETAGLRRFGTWRHRKKDGTLIDVEVHSHQLLFGDRPARLVLVQDVSERRKLEERATQQQKMEAVGRLASGVAHDFNNVLGVITGYAELIQRSAGSESTTARRAEEILKAASSAARLTQQLQTFSKPKAVSAAVLDVNAAVSQMESLLRRLIGEHIQLVIVFEKNGITARIDGSQFEQILLNLAVNARDAMPKGGRLVIETSRADFDPASRATDRHLKPGDYAVVSVSDTGMGMTSEVVAHIFEPFFTTKGPGKGTGLGLATVYGIVQQAGGQVYVYSEPDHGTTFKVYVPCADGPGAAAAQASPLASTAREGNRGTETILLVEDETALQAILAEMLEDGGYKVLVAGGPEEALRIAAEREVDLLLTDVVMPRIMGPALAERVRALRPGIRVIYMSGYTGESAAGQSLMEISQEALIEKPFTSDALLRAVRRSLA
jgi:two-component system, cell cycle sensor histidine kinase and response regulator CckA